jgi:phospholipid/cholesterol/gamma-HCH transport system substrate-binding protein
MIFGKTKLELKVGIFVFIGLAILLVFIILIGDFKTKLTGYRVNFTFNFINGVKIGAPVRFAGVDAGEVSNIRLQFLPEESRTEVIVNCVIRKHILVPRDSSVSVNTLGLLGEKYIEIMPGKDFNNTLYAGSTIAGIDPISMNDFTQAAKSIVNNLEEATLHINSGEGTLGKLLYDDALYNDLNLFIEDLRKNPWKLFWKERKNR